MLAARFVTISSVNQKNSMSVIHIPKSSIHKSLQLTQECELILNRFSKMIRARVGPISSLNQKKLMPMICNPKTTLHKSLELMPEREVM
jgi:hypothetical protein